MTVFAGLDLNGLWDRSALREEETSDLLLKDGGINGAAIRLSHAEETLVVGPQAAFAPHGRGQGWGSILGHERLRIGIAAALEAVAADLIEPEQEEALATLINELSAGARSIVLAVPDDESFDEGSRDRMLQLLRQTRAPFATLLWRTVAAALGWTADQTTLPTVAKHGAQVAVLSILRDRVHFGDLTLESHSTRRGELIVPVRRQSGIVVLENFGGATTARWVAQKLSGHHDLKSDEVLLGSRLPWLLAVGEKGGKELFRCANRTWRDLEAPSIPLTLMPDYTANDKVFDRLEQADVILIEGPAAGETALTRGVLEALGVSEGDPRLHNLDCCAVSRGCLEANERLHRGDPAYFDFLPQLEINALVQGVPEFVSLIKKDERLPGGRNYRAHAPGQFALSPRATALTFYLIKEDFEHPRKSEVTLSEVADKQHLITVSVEQLPGQGYAKVSIGSDSFLPLRQRPVELDWTKMIVVSESRDNILSELATNTGYTYPKIQIYPGHPVVWHPQAQHGDPMDAFTVYVETPLFEQGTVTERGSLALQAVQKIAATGVSLARQRQRLGIAIDGFGSGRLLGTDGVLPLPGINLPMPEGAESVLDAAVRKAEADFRALLKQAAPDPQVVRWTIGFATWCFWRCRQGILDDILNWYETDGAGPTPDQNVRIQGMGRAIHRPEDICRFLEILDKRLIENVRIKNSEYAALGRILGGNEEGGKLLEPRTADRLLQAAISYIVDENAAPRDEAYKLKFKSALLMLAVLLRHRMRRPSFLNASEKAACTLLTVLGDSKENIEKYIKAFERSAAQTTGKTHHQRLAAAARLWKIFEIVDELMSFINEDGGDPNIIQRIEDLI